MLLIRTILFRFFRSRNVVYMDFKAQLQKLKTLKEQIQYTVSQQPETISITDQIKQLPLHTSTSTGYNDHIALLFLVIDDLPYEVIWRRWISHHHVDVFIHAKYPDRIISPWVRKHLVPSNLQPNWGSVEIVQAELLLMENALRKSSAGRFIFLSESCVPVLPCQRLIDMQCHQSILDLRMQPENGYAESLQFAPLSRHIPRDKIAKASQWCLLIREDVNVILQCDHLLLPLFEDVSCSDEMFLSTCLVLLDKPTTKAAITFTQWLDTTDPSPQYIDSGTLQEVIHKQSFLFARKLQLPEAEIIQILEKKQIIFHELM